MAKKKEIARVFRQENVAPGIFDMWVETTLAKDAHAGQFVNIYPKDSSRLLPRPISICEVNADKTMLRLVYRVAGKGTDEFSKYMSGDTISVLGVLGNGFPVEKAAGKKVFLMGGGIGIPPMLELAKEIGAAGGSSLQIIAGYRNRNIFLADDLKKYGQLYIATEDGSVGSQGTVMNVISEHTLQADLIYTCGPMPMLRAVKQYAAENGIEAYLSLEERMACGVGACLGCVCKTKETDVHSHVKNSRICTDGPVYNALEVEI